MKRASSGSLLISALSLGVLGGCERGEPPLAKSEPAWIVLVPAIHSEQPLEPLRVEPRARSVTRVGGRIVVEVDANEDVRVTPREGCSLRVDARSLAPGERVERTLDDWFGWGGPHVDGGYGETVTLAVSPHCDEAKPGPLEWRQVAGPASPRLAPSSDGRALEVVLPTIEQAHAYFAHAKQPEMPGALLGLSPRTRGSIVLEAAWQRPGGVPVVRRVTLSAAARLRGLPNVAVNTPIALKGSFRFDTGDLDDKGTSLGQGGAPSAVRSRSPHGWHASEDGYGNTWLSATHPGGVTLRSSDGARVNVQSERLDATPLDCGRSGCHAAIARSAATSPMTTVMARLLGEGSSLPLGPGESYPACAIGCHAVGEPGLDDGGFVGALHAHGLRVADLSGSRFDDIPEGAQQLAGVTCLGCHGPAAIPEPDARWTLLQTEVCATCHDAPPRYGHVVAWTSSAMGHGAQARRAADDTDRSTRDAACAGCHTTAGFLGRLGDAKVDAPPGLGLTCVTCHDAHPAPAAAGPGLFRRVEALPSVLGEQAKAVPASVRPCVSCHTPPELAPRANEPAVSSMLTLGPSQAALLAGRGGLAPADGAPLVGPAPHWAIAGGCVGCHDQGPSELQRGRDHAFRASNDCACCHDEKPLDRTLHERARRLLERAGSAGVTWAGEAARTARQGGMNAAAATPKSDAAAPTHARAVPTVSVSTPRERAAYDALLVYEDAGAVAHNLPYARALLEAAEKALDDEEPQGD